MTHTFKVFFIIIFVFSGLVLIPDRVEATMVCSPSNFNVVQAGFNTATPSITLPTAVPAGALLVLGIYDRTDTTTLVNSVSDNLNGSSGWSLASINNHTWFYYKTNSSAGNITITPTLSTAINTHMAAGWCTDDSGILQFDATASVVVFPSSSSVNSGAITTYNSGGLIGFVGGDGSASFTANGQNESVITPYIDGYQRTHMFFEPHSTGGTFNFQLTPSSAIPGVFHIVAFSVAGNVSPSPPSPTPIPPPPTPTPTPSPTPTPNPPPSGTSTFDSSEYRQNTYGLPDYYCDPTRALNDNGTGTLSNPWNLLQCQAMPVAGDVVGVLPGVGVRLPSTDNDNIPTFQPARSGTSSNRIVYVTKYAAVALLNVATNPNRTELRHDGTPGVANGWTEIGTGSAMYGVNGRSYVTFDGFFVDMAQAEPQGDSGVIRVEGGTGVHFRNFEIKGTETNLQSNPIIYRPNGAVDTVLSNFRVYDYYNNTSGSATPQAALFSDQYSDQNVLIEHFEIRNTQRGIFFKGLAGGGPGNYGTIRYGTVSQVDNCYMFDFLSASNITSVYNVGCYNVTGAGVQVHAQTQPGRNLLFQNITIAKADITNQGACFKVTRNGIVDTNTVTWRDNLCDVNSSGSGGWFVSICDGGQSGNSCVNMPSIPLMNYNRYYSNGGTNRWQHGTDSNPNNTYTNIASWRTATGQEANSNILTTSPFVNRSLDDYTILLGHAAKTASSIGGEVGAYGGTNEVIGVVASTYNISPTPTPPPPSAIPVLGDLDLNHVVNSLDWSIMNSQWFTGNSQSDLRVDGQVNSLDFAILSSNWGRTW